MMVEVISSCKELREQNRLNNSSTAVGNQSAHRERAMTLEWPSHKTIAMGGRNPAAPVQELWYLRFDEDWEKFAAMKVDGAVATGVDQEVMHAIVRRLFVSASHEFCSSAKECGQRLQA
eukprot:s547_g8.t1